MKKSILRFVTPVFAGILALSSIFIHPSSVEAVSSEDNVLEVYGESTNELVIEEADTENYQIQDKLDLLAFTYRIQPENDQIVSVPVFNYSDRIKLFYAQIDQGPADLSIEFSKNGTSESPIPIGAGSKETIELKIGAKNAKKDLYEINLKIFSYSAEQDQAVEEDIDPIYLTCLAGSLETPLSPSEAEPVISNLLNGKVYSQEPFFLVVPINNYGNLLESTLTIDGNPVEYNESVVENTKNLIVFNNGLPIGEHVLNARITYINNQQKQTIDKDFSFTVIDREHHYINVIPDESLKGKIEEIFIAGFLLDITETKNFKELENGTYQYDVPKLLWEQKDRLAVCVKYENGLFISDLQETINVTKNGSKELSIEGNDHIQITKAFIDGISIDNNKSISFLSLQEIDIDNPMSLTPGKYHIYFHYLQDGFSLLKILNIDLTQADQKVDLYNTENLIEFNLDSSIKDSSFSSTVSFVKPNGDSSFSYIRNARKDNKLLVDFADLIKNRDFMEAEKAVLVLSSSLDKYWIIDITKGSPKQTQLSLNDLVKVTIKPNDPEIRLDDEYISLDGLPRLINLYNASTFYVSPGDYDIEIKYNKDYALLKEEFFGISLENDYELKLELDQSKIQQVKLNWPDQWGNSLDPSISSIYQRPVNQGESVTATKPADFNLGINFRYRGTDFSIVPTIPEDGKVESMDIQDTFTGRVYISQIYPPKTNEFLFTGISTPIDQNGNILRSISGYFIIEAVFTKTDHPETVFKSRYIPKESNFYLTGVPGPSEPGKYSVKLSYLVPKHQKPRIGISFNTPKTPNPNSFISYYIYTEEGLPMESPKQPELSGYEFTGWYTDPECKTLYDFSLPVNNEFTLYAGWKKKSKPSQPDSQDPASSTPSKSPSSSQTPSSSPSIPESQEPENSKSSEEINNPDGSITIKVIDKDGTITETTTGKLGIEVEEIVLNKQENSKITTTKEKNGTISKMVQSLNGKDFKSASIEVGSKAAADAAQNDRPVIIAMPKIPADKKDESIQIEVKLSEEIKETKIALPVENGNPGSVAMIEDENGQLVPIKESLVDENGKLIVPLDGSKKIVIKDNSKAFTDMPGYDKTSYPGEGVAYVSARKIFNGNEDGSFNLNGNVTRGMLARVLYNLEGNPSVAGLPVPAGVAIPWYKDASAWAANKKLMAQGSDFRGEDLLTREQLAMILWREQGKPAARGDISVYDPQDVASISSPEMREAVSWAVGEHIIGQNSRINGQKESTRGEVANMLYRYLTKANRITK